VTLIVEANDRKIKSHLKKEGLFHNFTKALPNIESPIMVLRLEKDVFIRWVGDSGPDGQYIWLALRGKPTVQERTMVEVALLKLIAGSKGIVPRGWPIRN